MTGSTWGGVDLRDMRAVVADGRLHLQLELSRNMLGGQPTLYVQTIDPINPRRKPVPMLPGPLLPPEGGTHSDLLRLIADVLDGTVDTVPFVTPD